MPYELGIRYEFRAMNMDVGLEASEEEGFVGGDLLLSKAPVTHPTEYSVTEAFTALLALYKSCLQGDQIQQQLTAEPYLDISRS